MRFNIILSSFQGFPLKFLHEGLFHIKLIGKQENKLRNTLCDPSYGDAGKTLADNSRIVKVAVWEEEEEADRWPASS